MCGDNPNVHICLPGFNIEYFKTEIKKVGIWEEGVFTFGLEIQENGKRLSYLLNKKHICLRKSNIKVDKIIQNSKTETNQIDKDDTEYTIFEKNEKILMSEVMNEDFFKYWNMTDVDNVYEKGAMTYEGQIINLQACGFGILEFQYGSKYEGYWKNGLPHGHGNYLNPGTNEVFSGFWENGLRHGKGTMIFRNKEKYEGEWIKDKPMGWGVFLFSNGNTFTGFIILKMDSFSVCCCCLFMIPSIFLIVVDFVIVSFFS